MSDIACLCLVSGGVAVFLITVIALRSRAIQENVKLHHMFKISGIPAQAALDDLAPPLRISVSRAREIMEMIK